jgi:bisphosphoglycerate-independent phosphoglycerate mutase (AlkP superfamily)
MRLGGVALITADHGNADEMFELDKKTKLPATEHWMARSRPRPRTR